MLRKAFLELLYESAHMQRWNDHIRPKGFTELDKQAHKMIIAFVLARFAEDAAPGSIQWRCLIEGGIFEFLHRLCLTDIKPPVFHELMATHGDQLNRWVMQELESKISALGTDFGSRFEQYFFDASYSGAEKKILRAAHYLATNWEFRIIKNLNSSFHDLRETQERIEAELEEHADLIGVQKIVLDRKIGQFVNYVGQLRFQQRWAQSPRVPETSVMGHMLIVGILGYVLSVEIGACERRICNNYFTGLFHDLPEVLTRDIVSPVKRSVAGLDELIKGIEHRLIDEKLLPLLPPTWHGQINYYIRDEFSNRILVDGKLQEVASGEIDKLYNEDCYEAVDGELLKACDHFAAYIEAKLSLAHGMQAHHLREGAEELYQLYKNKHILGLDFGQYFDYFQ